MEELIKNQPQDELTLPSSLDELKELLQKEGDKRVTGAMAKLEAKKNEEIAEAQKLAQMGAAEKYQYELDQRENALKEKEEKLAMSINRLEASKILADKGLPLELTELVTTTNSEETFANITALEKSFNKAVEAKVTERLKGTTPYSPAKGNQVELPDFKNMGLDEIAAWKAQQ